ncbi:MAG: Rpp14/Pop5 family protein [Candidatus Micrarchaeota archaeon]
MVKARALKKRYVLFELRGQEMAEEPLKRAIYADALRFFGELGLSKVALKLVKFDQSKKMGVLRCERDQLDDVLGFLALVDSLDGRAARLVSLRSSGTIKALETEASSQEM